MTYYENYCKHLPTLSGQHRIMATDNPINGQNSVYVVTEQNGLPVAQITFRIQSHDKDGILQYENYESGVTDLDLLEILRHRLNSIPREYLRNDDNLDDVRRCINNTLYFLRQSVTMNQEREESK
jgi:hypothetical protein